MCNAPVFADAEIHFERHRQAQLLADVFHFLPHQPLGFLQIMVRHFEDQFVVDLEDHFHVRQFVMQFLVDVDHSHFDQIRSGALDGAVHRHAFAEATLYRITALELRNRTAAAEDRGRVTFLPSFGDVPIHQGTDGWESFKEGFDVCFGFSLGYAEILRKAERTDPIDDAEDDGLGRAAHVSRDLTGRAG